MNTDSSSEKPTTPFIVYAADSPTYPEFAFCLRSDIWSSKDVQQSFQGSAIAISGGVSKPDQIMGDDVPIIRQDGLVQGDIGWRFAERAVASLVEPDDRVTLIYGSESILHDVKRLQSMRIGGFQVLNTVDGYICNGNGNALRTCQWMEGVCSSEDLTLIVSREHETLFEAAILDVVMRGSDIKTVLWSFLDEVGRDPESMPRFLHGYSLYADMGGPNGYNLGIYRPDTDIPDLVMMFGAIAAELGIRLYDAGSLSEIDATGHAFAEFHEFGSCWKPLPKHWKSIV